MSDAPAPIAGAFVSSAPLRPRPRRLFLRSIPAGALATVGIVAGCAEGKPAGPPALVEGLPPRTAPPTGTPTQGEGARLPGAGTAFAGMASRALANLSALDGPFPDVPDASGRWRTSAGVSGAAIAGWAPAWRYVWPRDASFAVAALTVAGQLTQAASVLDFLAGVAPADGRWEARYLPDGSGEAPDGRGVQADGGGWVCWAVWALLQTPGDSTVSAAGRRLWWPMVAASADAMTAALDGAGEPPPSPDYWETPTENVTIETLTAFLVGLRAAAALARHTGSLKDAATWSAAAGRIASALNTRWAPRGYPRSLPDGGADAAVGLLAALAPDLPQLGGSVIAAGQLLKLPNAGVRPGQRWPHDDGSAWTPEVAMLALGARRTAPATSTRWLRWLDAHRTNSGALSEKVAPNGSPSGVAPLGWTAALTLLTLAPQVPVPIGMPA